MCLSMLNLSTSTTGTEVKSAIGLGRGEEGEGISFSLEDLLSLTSNPIWNCFNLFLLLQMPSGPSYINILTVTPYVVGHCWHHHQYRAMVCTHVMWCFSLTKQPPWPMSWSWKLYVLRSAVWFIFATLAASNVVLCHLFETGCWGISNVREIEENVLYPTILIGLLVYFD